MVTNKFIAKIEGHGELLVDWKKNKVKLKILEGERLFEGMLVGRTCEEAHWITPRICGVCPVAHHIASVKAGEASLNIVPNKTTLLLRDLMTCGQHIQSHFLHLFFLALPDYVGIDRGTELAKKDPVSFKRAIALKEISDAIVFLVGGRNVHPMTTTVGGFHKIPIKESLKKLLQKLEKTEEAAQKTVEFFSGLEYPELKVDLDLIAQAPRGTKLPTGEESNEDCIITVASNKVREGKFKKSPVRFYKRDFEEEVKDYSTAKFARYKKREVLTGSLARLAAFEKDYRKFVKPKFIEQIDFENPFHNNFAQAIEILYFHKKAQNIVNQLLKGRLDPTIIKPKANPPLKGIGTVEAPRGGLYHEIHLENKKGLKPGKNSLIVYANIITPTVQNLTSIEKSAETFLSQKKHRSQKQAERMIKMIVRAYDPCITCSVH
ncbi:MAG: hypothetical protein COV69_01310 [Parcubacteria group bacterium CG11_big_fil_rev_8_21_14_0_20_39_14]|nr:MAG: hypothetical protein COV69_01310 [Parcubacteria group bacterium CG11_big_fil_rev_8_21_14_0_20_39_14]PIS35088.1 MAG: hypothetical protein COT36_04010 [Parcubacteria group bacterium CG08_land_8_20_14_0_20_38_56]